MTRMGGAARVACLSAMLATGLAGCSLFGSDEEEVAEVPQPVAPAEAPRLPVAEVERLEIGRTRGGVMLAAFGRAAGPGYSRGGLVARNGGRPAQDGLLDFDFVAAAPPAGVDLPAPTPRNRAIRADAEVSIEDIRGVRGVRVHGARGGVQVLF